MAEEFEVYKALTRKSEEKYARRQIELKLRAKLLQLGIALDSARIIVSTEELFTIPQGGYQTQNQEIILIYRIRFDSTLDAVTFRLTLD